VVYTKFRDINEKLIRINDERKHHNYNVLYSFTGSQVATPRSSDVTSPPCVIIYEKDFYCPKDKSFPLANTIELFRIKHWLSREAISDLQYLFGFQMGMSITILAITSLFDIYTELFYAYTNSSFTTSVFRTKMLFIGWMLQYSTRLGLIIFTAHATVQQVGKTSSVSAYYHACLYLDYVPTLSTFLAIYAYTKQVSDLHIDQIIRKTTMFN